MRWPEDYASLAVIIASTGGLLGAFWTFVIMPQIRQEIVKPVRETHQQITENGGRNDPPTLPDRFHALQESVDGLTESMAERVAEDARAAKAQALMQANLSAIVLVLDEHLRWSRDYVARAENGNRTEEEE